MLIHLDESAVTDATSASPTAQRSQTCLENLLRAHGQGDHVISLLPDHAERLITLGGWSREALRALRHVNDNFAQIAGLRADLPYSMELGLGAHFDGKLDNRVIRAPLHAFERLQTVACATLLGENRTDAELYRELGEIRKNARGWGRISMIHTLRGGGGDTTVREHEGLIEEGNIVLTIADADRKHPGSDVGGTYRKLRDAEAEKHPPAYQKVRELHVRMAECLVPIEVYQEVLESPERQGNLARLAALLRSSPRDILRYAHLKDGLRLYQVEYPSNEGEGAYWSRIAQRMGRNQCTKPAREACANREDCQCYVVDPVGGGALDQVVTWMSNVRDKRRLARRFDVAINPAPANPENAALADEVLAWGVALAPLHT